MLYHQQTFQHNVRLLREYMTKEIQILSLSQCFYFQRHFLTAQQEVGLFSFLQRPILKSDEKLVLIAKRKKTNMQECLPQ